MIEHDYLFLEDLFIQHIRNEVTGLVDVKGLPDLQVLEDQTQASPMVYVIYLGDGVLPGPQGHGGMKKVQVVKQYWAFVLSVQTADAVNDGEAARREAGPILGNLMVALQGWKPADDVDPMARAERSAPVVYRDGCFYFPLVFYTTFVFPRQRKWGQN
ncbi:MAG TPA: hypothetical protein VL995_10240 [Cellvibrio sp.]|nr:hypothetical protein [Cellvibrio sp.]